MIARISRYVFGLAFLALSITAALRFDSISKLFLSVSPDGIISNASFLELRIILVSFGVIGLALLSWKQVRSIFTMLGDYFMLIKARDFLLWSLGIGLLLRAVVVIFLPLHLYSDYGNYDQLAWTWVNVGGYYNGDHPTGYCPVGYPFFLSRHPPQFP